MLERLEWRGRVSPRALDHRRAAPDAGARARRGGGRRRLRWRRSTSSTTREAARRPFDLGWTLLVRGRLCRRARQKRAAADALGEALAIFESLGALAWIEQARHELDRVGLRRAPAELTATEHARRRARAAGLTNKEVAAQAFMSPKTVEANLARDLPEARDPLPRRARRPGRGQARRNRRRRGAEGRRLATILFTDLVLVDRASTGARRRRLGGAARRGTTRRFAASSRGSAARRSTRPVTASSPSSTAPRRRSAARSRSAGSSPSSGSTSARASTPARSSSSRARSRVASPSPSARGSWRRQARARCS